MNKARKNSMLPDILFFVVVAFGVAVELNDCLTNGKISGALIVLGCLVVFSGIALISKIRDKANGRNLRTKKADATENVIVPPKTSANERKPEDENPIPEKPEYIATTMPRETVSADYPKALDRHEPDLFENLHCVTDIRDSCIVTKSNWSITYATDWPRFWFKLTKDTTVEDALEEILGFKESYDKSNYKSNVSLDYETILVVDPLTSEICKKELLRVLSNHMQIRVVTNPEDNVFHEFAFENRICTPVFIESGFRSSVTGNDCVCCNWNVQDPSTDGDAQTKTYPLMISLSEGDSVSLHEMYSGWQGGLRENVDLKKINGAYCCSCFGQTDRFNVGCCTIDVPDDFVVDDKVDIDALIKQLKKWNYI